KAVVAICWHWNPLVPLAGGIQSVIRDIIRYAPSDFEFVLFSICDTPQKLHKNLQIMVAGRECTVIPVLVTNDSLFHWIPLRVRYAFAIRKYLALNGLSRCAWHLHGIESWWILRKYLPRRSSILFLHSSPSNKWRPNSG